MGVEPSHGAVDSRSNPTTATRSVPLASAQAACPLLDIAGAIIHKLATTTTTKTASRTCRMRPPAFPSLSSMPSGPLVTVGDQAIYEEYRQGGVGQHRLGRVFVQQAFPPPVGLNAREKEIQLLF